MKIFDNLKNLLQTKDKKSLSSNKLHDCESQVILSSNDEVLAIGLYWQTLFSQDTIKKEIVKISKSKSIKVRATKYVKYIAPSEINSQDVYGFYKGKLPSKINGVNKTNSYSLASIFCKEVEKEAILVYLIGKNEYGLITCKNNHPIDDYISLSKELLVTLANNFKNDQQNLGTTLYFDERIEESLLDALKENYPSNKNYDLSAIKVNIASELKSIPSDISLGKLLLIIIPCLLAFFVYDYYDTLEKRARYERNKVSPEKMYIASRDKLLQQTGLISASEFIKVIRESEIWVNSNKGGWLLSSIQCNFSGEVVCIRTWSRKKGLTTYLRDELDKELLTISLENISDKVILDVPRTEYDLTSIPSLASQNTVWSSWFQNIINQVRDRNTKLEGKEIIKVDLSKNLLVGSWGKKTNINSKENVYSGNWKVDADLSWLHKFEKLSKTFLIINFKINVDDKFESINFSMSGIYLGK